MANKTYTTEVPYLRTFSNDLSPALLRVAVALSGYSPPPADDFDYCEVGCGNGDNCVTLAAASPGSRFVGIDLGAEHIAFANKLALKGGVTNAAFLERDFEALRDDDLPQFDYICAHGLVSWVSTAKRRAFFDFCARKLKPGGLVYVAYNALPGWAGLSPLRRLIQDGAASAEGDLLQKAARGLALAKLLCDSGSAYFESNPTAKAMVETMSKAGLPYVVHEYLQPHWHPMYFADIAREMSDRGLSFASELPLHLNYRNLTLGPVLVELTNGVTDRLVFESLKDFALNELFRRDLFVKQSAPRSDEIAREVLDGTVFGTLGFPDKLPRELRLPHTTLDLRGPVFDVALPALAEHTLTLADLRRWTSLASHQPGELREAMLYLLMSGHAFPMREPTSPPDPTPGGLYRLVSPFNHMVVTQKLSPRTPIVLAVPAAGAGLPLTMLEAICLRIVTQAGEEERPRWIRSFVERQPLKLFVRDKPVEGPEEQARVLSQELSQFCEKRLPKLKELGLVERVGGE